MSYLRFLCLSAHSGVQHILCCVFASFFYVLCTSTMLHLVYFYDATSCVLLRCYVLCTSTMLRLVYAMLSVSLDCPFLTAPLVFSNV